jgi:DNA-binding MurR/RpiR family transcriptional regulator
MSDNEMLKTALRTLLPELGTQLSIAAQFVLSHPDQVVSCSMRELARRAQVPPVTFVRLAQRLGMPSYTALRQRIVAQVLGPQGEASRMATRNLDSARAIAAATRSQGKLLEYARQCIEAEKQLLDRALAGLSEQQLDRASTLLAKAPRVFVVARRTAFAVAFSFAYALQKVRPNVVLLDDAGGAPEAPLEDASAGDVLVAVTFAPFSRVTQMLGEQALARRMELIVIADSEVAPLAASIGHQLLIAPAISYAFPESGLAAQAIANLLTALTVSRLGAAAQKRIKANEQRLVASGEYVLARRRSRRRPAVDD